jgi:hypothetical protein
LEQCDNFSFSYPCDAYLLVRLKFLLLNWRQVLRIIQTQPCAAQLSLLMPVCAWVAIMLIVDSMIAALSLALVYTRVRKATSTSTSTSTARLQPQPQLKEAPGTPTAPHDDSSSRPEAAAARITQEGRQQMPVAQQRRADTMQAAAAVPAWLPALRTFVVPFMHASGPLLAVLLALLPGCLPPQLLPLLPTFTISSAARSSFAPGLATGFLLTMVGGGHLARSRQHAGCAAC